MTLNKAIITTAEADVTLALEADWIALTDPVKTDHIAKASVYMQTAWTCADIEWDDSTTISSDIQEACAYYALADSVGNLYPDSGGTPTGMGNVIEETKKAGTLQKTVKYSDYGFEEGSDLLSYPNSIMSVECYASGGSGSKKAIRT